MLWLTSLQHGGGGGPQADRCHPPAVSSHRTLKPLPVLDPRRNKHAAGAFLPSGCSTGHSWTGEHRGPRSGMGEERRASPLALCVYWGQHGDRSLLWATLPTLRQPPALAKKSWDEPRHTVLFVARACAGHCQWDIVKTEEENAELSVVL